MPVSPGKPKTCSTPLSARMATIASLTFIEGGVPSRDGYSSVATIAWANGIVRAGRLERVCLIVFHGGVVRDRSVGASGYTPAPAGACAASCAAERSAHVPNRAPAG